jgi:hypothetical protein
MEEFPKPSHTNQTQNLTASLLDSDRLKEFIGKITLKEGK